VTGACEGLIALGEANDVDEEILDRAAAIADACEGASWEELAGEYGPENATAAGQVVGSFFKKLSRGIKKAGRGLAKGALKFAPDAMAFVPGVGPVASAAFRHASPMLQKALMKQKHKPRSQRSPLAAQSAFAVQPFDENMAHEFQRFQQFQRIFPGRL